MGGQVQTEKDDQAAAPVPLLSLRRLWPLLVLVAGLIGFLALDGDAYFTLDSLRLYRADLAEYVDHHTVGMALLFAAAYMVMVAFSLPGALVMTITCGFFFGSFVEDGGRLSGKRLQLSFGFTVDPAISIFSG